MNQSQFTPELEAKIQAAGWQRIYCNNKKLKNYDKKAAIYVKSTKIEEIFKNSANANPQIPCVSTDIENAPNNSNGCCNDMVNKLNNYNNLNNSYSFNSEFINKMRSDDFNLLLSCDHCWRGSNNQVISYNYGLIHNDFIYSFIFFPFSNLNSILNFDFMLGVMLDYLNFTSYRLLRKNIIKYKYIDSLNDNTSLKEYRKSGHYTQDTSSKTLSLDYDMKRKPIRSTLKAEYVDIDGVQYDMAHIATEPFVDTAEMLLYRAVRSEMKCLRTSEEWNRFFETVALRQQGITGVMTTVEHDRKILRSCVLGYRAGMWDIPYLANKKISLDAKIQWINSFNSSTNHPYTKNEWKKAGEKSRQKNIMSYEEVKPLLNRMQNYN